MRRCVIAFLSCTESLSKSKNRGFSLWTRPLLAVYKAGTSTAGKQSGPSMRLASGSKSAVPRTRLYVSNTE